ncbi:hypothetical protein Tco_1376826 [Tanacetum coccineum]
MTTIPIARKIEAASNGVTGHIANEPTNIFPNKPANMATRPFPRNTALEKVMDSHCCSKPLYNLKVEDKLAPIHNSDMQECLDSRFETDYPTIVT